jgi:hypothetical protein
MVNRFLYLFVFITIATHLFAAGIIDTSMTLLTESNISHSKDDSIDNKIDAIPIATRFLRKTQQSANILALQINSNLRVQKNNATITFEIDEWSEPLIRRLCGIPNTERNEKELLFDGRYPYLTQSSQDIYLNCLLVYNSNSNCTNCATLFFTFLNSNGFLLHQKRIIRMPIALTDTCFVSLSFIPVNEFTRVKNHSGEVFENSAAFPYQSSQLHEPGKVSTLSNARDTALLIHPRPTIEHFFYPSDELSEEEENAPVFAMPAQPVSSFTFIPRTDEPAEPESQSIIQEPVFDANDGGTSSQDQSSDSDDGPHGFLIDR